MGRALQELDAEASYRSRCPAVLRRQALESRAQRRAAVEISFWRADFV